ncbi:hypothetical protein KNW02_17120 [Paracoccus sp. XHP0099]|uniref:Uncharacterized protein n=2 Tax=Paracoccus marinaquae TaxID=2841926 RepID=A0ABS6AML1_9RHOB|nr:hypothetical protein [Paracoccus marinaquae]MBU3031829.1 hypothetical protein [Paracoccus marinaquae]
MTRVAQSFEDVQAMADEVSRLMVARYGGARRGERPPLHVMLRRRGGALPQKLRRPASQLAEADRISAQPKVARQLDLQGLSRAHAALIGHLRPLGELSRWRGRAISFAASVSFGMLVLAAVILWLMVRRGHL